MNQSISEEWEKLFEGHCICDKYAPQEDIGCIIHGEDGIKAKKFIQSKISEAIAEERKELREKVEAMPVNYDFDASIHMPAHSFKEKVLDLIKE